MGETGEKWIVRRGFQDLADVVDGRPIWTNQAREALYWQSRDEAIAVMRESAGDGWMKAFNPTIEPDFVHFENVEKGPRLMGPPLIDRVRDLLLLVDRDIHREIIAQWSFLERAHAARWAGLVHTRANGDPVVVPPEPECVRFALLGESRAVQRVELARQILTGGAREADIRNLARLVLDPRGHAGRILMVITVLVTLCVALAACSDTGGTLILELKDAGLCDDAGIDCPDE